MNVLISHPTSRQILTDTLTETPYNGRLDGNVLYIWDVFDDATLENIFRLYGIPKYIFCDSMPYYSSCSGVDIYSIDYWLAHEITKFYKCNLPEVEKIQTTHTANFLINKKQINRFLLIKFCGIFDIDCSYTWSGIGKDFELSWIINEKSKLRDKKIDAVWPQILSPITQFDSRWIPYNNSQWGDSSISNYAPTTVWPWNNGLDKVVSQTAVSLISESVWTQVASSFTEKTAYAMLGLTFPLWIGGVNMAAEWQKKGFDIFEDVIDHSYQNMPTLIERCFYAFELNKEILTNLELAKNLRTSNVDRLVENRNKLLGDTVEKYNQAKVATWPEEIKHIALPLMQKFAE
jgi:hypothetical protein